MIVNSIIPAWDVPVNPRVKMDSHGGKEQKMARLDLVQRFQTYDPVDSALYHASLGALSVSYLVPSVE